MTTYSGMILDRSGAVINVKHPDFGAIGDGMTDDRAAIQAAVNAATSSGGTVLFPPNDPGKFYALSAGISVTTPATNLMLSGYGAVLKLKGNASSDAQGRVLSFAAGQKNLLIAGLRIDGNAAAQTSSEQRSGIFLFEVDGASIVDCVIERTMGDCIQIEASHDAVNTNRNIKVQRCVLRDAMRHLIGATDLDEALFSEIDGAGAQQGGIHLEAEGVSPSMRRIGIVDCSLRDVGKRNVTQLDAAISIAGRSGSSICHNAVVSNNRCEDQGIYVAGVRDVTICGNVVRNSRGRTVSGNSVDGFGIFTRAPAATIVGNVIDTPSQFGIIVDGAGETGEFYGASASTIASNTITGLPATSSVAEGIRLISIVGASVCGNVVGNSASTAYAWGFRFLGSSTRPVADVVVANNIVRNLAYGFVEGADVAGLRLLFNVVIAASAAEYSVSASTSVLKSVTAPAWGVMTGSPLRTGFDASTVSVIGLAQRFGALLDDLKSYGILK